MINLNLTLEELNHVLALLGKFAYDDVANLVLMIRAQATPQVQKIIDDANKQASQTTDGAPSSTEPVTIATQ